MTTVREATYQVLRDLGMTIVESQANFVMLNIRTEAGPVIDKFWRRKILAGREFPPMTKFLRVSLGTDEEMKEFYSAFRQILH